MPIYEYECSSCKFYSELLQKISDPPLKKCPSCGKSTMKKLISAPSFRLKGGGWYETDFKSEGENKRNLADREEPADKSDSKPDAKDKHKSDSAAPAKPAGKTGAKKPAAKKAPARKAKPVRKPAAPAKGKRRGR